MLRQSSQSEVAILLKRVSLGFARRGSTDSLLDGVSMEVVQGEAVCLQGPSGCGKSSLLFLMAGLLKPLSGSVKIWGTNLLSLRRRQLRLFRRGLLHLMPQSLELFPHLSVLENLLAVQSIQDALDFRAGRQALKEVGLLDKCDLRPMQLSGGERQRACLARALVSQAPICLLDEPTSNLDGESALRVVGLVDKERQKGRTFVVATQDPAFESLLSCKFRIEDRHFRRIS